MATVKHPRIPNVTVNVPDGDVSRWQASGWVADEPQSKQGDETEGGAPTRAPRRRKK